MKIQVLSDLHLEHGGFVPEHHPAADVIVLAGDLAPYTEGLVDQIADHWSSAPHILYVLGNHEFYGSEIDETRAGHAGTSLRERSSGSRVATRAGRTGRRGRRAFSFGRRLAGRHETGGGTAPSLAPCTSQSGADSRARQARNHADMR